MVKKRTTYRVFDAAFPHFSRCVDYNVLSGSLGAGRSRRPLPFGNQSEESHYFLILPVLVALIPTF